MQQHEYGDFGIEATSPEISKKDKATLATVCKLFVETLEILRQQGLHTQESLAKAEAILVKEYMEVDIIPLTEEELAMQQEPELHSEELLEGSEPEQNIPENEIKKKIA